MLGSYQTIELIETFVNYAESIKRCVCIVYDPQTSARGTLTLKAITLNVAEIFGFSDKLGSLDVGKTANVVLSNGDPLDVRTDVKQVFIDGVSQPMVSRQTRLRDEYSKK